MAAAPNMVDGMPLTPEQKKRLELIIGGLKHAEPLRGTSSRLMWAIHSWKKTVRPSKRGWVDKPYFRIGRGGQGPVVILSPNRKEESA